MKKMIAAALLAMLAVSFIPLVTQAADNPFPGLPIKHNDRIAELQAKLDESTELEFIEAPLTDVVEFLKTRHDVEIQIDHASLEESGVPTDTPITRNLKGISLRSALRLTLRDIGLTHVIRDEVILIMSQDKADGLLETRVYAVSDLLWAPDVDHEAVPAAFDELVAMVMAGTAPEKWQQNGGPGSITPSRTTHSLVIATNLETHEQIDGLLGTLREARNIQFGGAEAEPDPEADPESTPPAP